MSDGLPESVNAEGEVLGYQRLKRELVRVAAWYSEGSDRKGADLVLSEILRIGADWMEGCSELTDDLTVVVLQVVG